MGRPDNGLGGKTGEKTKGLGLSAETIAKLRQVQDFAKLEQKQFNLLRLHVNSAQAQSDFNLGLQFLLKTENSLIKLISLLGCRSLVIIQ